MSQQQRDHVKRFVARLGRYREMNLGPKMCRDAAAADARRAHPPSEDEQGAVDEWLLEKYPPLPWGRTGAGHRRSLMVCRASGKGARGPFGFYLFITELYRTVRFKPPHYLVLPKGTTLHAPLRSLIESFGKIVVSC